MNIPNTTPQWARPLITDWVTHTNKCPQCRRRQKARTFKPWETVFQFWCPHCAHFSNHMELPPYMPNHIAEWVKKHCDLRDAEEAQNTPP